MKYNIPVVDKKSDGYYILAPGKRVREAGDDYVLYTLWYDDVFISAAYGPSSLAVLTVFANQMKDNDDKQALLADLDEEDLY